MMEVIPFQAKHIQQIELQGEQEYLSKYVNKQHAEALVGDWAFTGIVNGVPVAAAGVIPMWQGRGMAWAYISKHAMAHSFIPVHKAVKRFLDQCYLHRIEMTVDCEFAEGHRWAHMLGFRLEAVRMRGYRPDGGDCALYARVR